MTDLQALLDVQHLDNELDQLRYRRENLPERAEIAAIGKEEGALSKATARTTAAREDLARRQRGFEDDAADMEGKAKGLETRLYDGSVTSPKEATVLGDEIRGMKSRQSDLEDQAIELMLEIEPFDEQLAAATAEANRMAGRRSELEGMVADAEHLIDRDIARVEADRRTAADRVGPEVLGQYQKLRITYGPDAVVEFDPGRGGGCPVAMSAVELDRWKHLPAGTLDSCTDCGRLVAKLT